MNNPSQGHHDHSANRSSHLPAKLVADGVVARFQHIQAVLAPVVGPGGVVALYKRSRHVSSRSYPWLAPANEGMRSGMNLDLKYLIAQQDDETAAAGAGFLLKSFHDLLSSLVGETLTIQVLGAPPISEPSPDKTP